MPKVVRMYSDTEIKAKLGKIFKEYCAERDIKLEDIFDMDFLYDWIRKGMPDLCASGHCKYATLLNPWLDELQKEFNH